MRVIMARVSTQYTGRIDAQLSTSDVVILLREPPDGDGSVLVYAMDKGVTPRNWMPAGSEIVEHDWGFDIVHDKRAERLQIWLDPGCRYQDVTAASSLQGELTKLGDERAFSDALATQLARLGVGFGLVQREYMTPAGPIDLLCTQGETPVCVEVKRRRITLADTYQLQRYLHALHEMPAWQQAPMPKGLLVAPVLAKNAKARIDASRGELRFVRLGWDDVC